MERELKVGDRLEILEESLWYFCDGNMDGVIVPKGTIFVVEDACPEDENYNIRWEGKESGWLVPIGGHRYIFETLKLL